MKEILKTILIVLLAVLMAALAAASLTMNLAQGGNVQMSFMSQIQPGSPPEDAVQLKPMMNFPRKIAVLGQHGVYAPWTSEEYLSVFIRFSNIFDEAAGSAGGAVSIIESEFTAAITDTGIVMNYDSDVYARFNKLCSFIAEEDFYVRTIIITGADAHVYMLFDTSVGYFRSDTAVSFTSLLNACTGAEYYNDAELAYTNEILANLLPGEISHLYSAYLPVYEISGIDVSRDEGITETILSTAGVNSDLAQSYVDIRNRVVYVEGDTTVAFNSDGEIVFTFSEDGVLTQSSGEPDVYQILEQAYRICSSIWARAGGSGELSLSILQENEGEIEIGFELILGGMPVLTRNIPAYVHVTKGHITGISITPMQANETGIVNHVPWPMQIAGLRDRSLRPAIAFTETKDNQYAPRIYTAE